MLTKYDEFLCHQNVSTFNTVGTSAREWTERVWFSVHDISGKYQLIAGFGYYPNRNVMDAFGCLVVDNKTQHAVRASRELRPRIDDVRVGPLSYEIVDPLNAVRFVLDDNEYDLSFDIEFRATMAAHEEDAQFTELRGRVGEHIKRFVQVGKPVGWIKVEGKKIEIDGNSWRAERDRSWGIRRGGGVPETGVQPGEIPEGHLHNFVALQFDDWGLTYHTRENWAGETLHFGGALFHPPGASQEPLKFVGVDHNFTFRPDIRQVNGGGMVVHAEDGSKIDLSIRFLSACYLTVGGYFGYQGFTHGLWMGEEFLDGIKIDLTDPEKVKEVAFLDDAVCEIRCGDEVGYGIVELVVIGKYPKYGYQGY
jgi:hypothetical protein